MYNITTAVATIDSQKPIDETVRDSNHRVVISMLIAVGIASRVLAWQECESALTMIWHVWIYVLPGAYRTRLCYGVS